MNLENVVIIIVCLVATAVVGYYLYTKYTNQQVDLLKLSKRCEALELLFLNPPEIGEELTEIYDREPNCNSGLCDLTPPNIINEQDLDQIIENEVEEAQRRAKVGETNHEQVFKYSNSQNIDLPRNESDLSQSEVEYIGNHTELISKTATVQMQPDIHQQAQRKRSVTKAQRERSPLKHQNSQRESTVNGDYSGKHKYITGEHELGNEDSTQATIEYAHLPLVSRKESRPQAATSGGYNTTKKSKKINKESQKKSQNVIIKNLE